MTLEDKVMKLEDKDWDILLPRIKKGDCTPFLGAAANHGILPLSSEIVKAWRLILTMIIHSTEKTI
jgi:hypothetical protein